MPNQTVFSSELLEEVHRRSRGIPRVINLLCDNLLVTAFAMEQRTATLEMLDEVSQDLRLEWPGSNRDRRGTVALWHGRRTVSRNACLCARRLAAHHRLVNSFKQARPLLGRPRRTSSLRRSVSSGRRAISLPRVPVILEPVTPNGCPIEMDPPFTLSLSIGIPRRSRQ